MKNKPLIFTILSVLFLIEPLIKILYFKAITRFDFALIFANLQARNTFKEILEFWLIFPIAGILILRLRKWTYFSFMAVLGYIVFKIFSYERYTWPYNSDSPFLYNYVVALGAVGVFLYFLSPTVRETFFDRRVRWWETKRRFNVLMPCLIQSGGDEISGEVLNISQTGAFIAEPEGIKVGESFLIKLNFEGEEILLNAKAVHAHKAQGKDGLGLQFKFHGLKEILAMKKFIKRLGKKEA